MAGPAAQARPHAAGLRRLSFLLALAAPATAHAGAWIVADEDRAIASVGYRDGADGVAGYETDFYGETALTDRLALVTRAFYAQDNLGFSEDEGDTALKVSLHRGRRTAAALQLGPTYTSVPTVEGCDRWGGEVRALVGAATRGGRGFLNAETAYRYSPGCNHVRYELTAGYRPVERWLSLGQVFVDDDLVFGEAIKLQAGVVRFTKSGRGVQLSLRMRVDGDGVTEPTLILGYWSRKRVE